MFKRILAVVLLFGIITIGLNGCKKKQDPDTGSSSEPDLPASVESRTQDTAGLRDDILSLDNTLHGWGQGNQTDQNNVPICCNDFNARYGKYGAVFGGNLSRGKTVYLTFDEGYENGYTAQILDTLKQKNCPAVFFVTMDYVKSQPELIRRMIEEGHMIGNHSTSHPSMPSLTAQKAAEEIQTLHDYVWDNFHYRMIYFRPPKGEFSERTLAITQDVGYTNVFWSFAYKDWLPEDQPEPHAALDKMVSRAHDGAIYLLHAVSSTNAAVLGDFIDKLREKGYTFSTQM